MSNLYKRRVPVKDFVTIDLAETLAEISYEIKKEIAVIINRRGQIVNITVGDSDKVDMESYKGIREGSARLCGLRCIHTHLSGADINRTDLVTLARNRLDAIVLITVDPEGTFSKKMGQQAIYADKIFMAYLMPEKDIEGNLWNVSGPMTIRNLIEEDFEELILSLEEEFSRKQADLVQVKEEERAILVGLFTKGNSKWEVEESIVELENLADTAGARVIHTIIQKKTTPDPAYFVGKGKAEEICLLAQEHYSNLVIIDAELSPRQQKNLEEIIGVKTIDRTELILDIFAQRAHTKEGKLQVELAQLKYLYPRLVGAGLSLSRQMGGGTSGGIATRGPGETKLETDRRAIRRRINHLESEVEQIRKFRKTQRKKRVSQGLPVAVLVGYTNTGKSTLLNALSDSDVFVEDKLFATLDPTTRRIVLPDRSYVLLSDTVGFIQRLPTSLVAAFRATLEEVSLADMIIHVVDASHPSFREQIDIVYDVLTELDASNKPILTVFNKVDLLESTKEIEDDVKKSPNPVFTSALMRKGLGKIVSKINCIINKYNLTVV